MVYIFTPQISSSFDSMDPFGTGQVLPPLQVPLPAAQDTIIPPLKKPPKWVRRPVGASFAVRKIFHYRWLKRVRRGEDSFGTFNVTCIFFSLSVWWKADNIWQSQADSSAEPPARPQTSVCEPGYHGNRVLAALQGAAGGTTVRLLQQLLPGQDSERQVRRWAGHMEVPAGRHAGIKSVSQCGGHVLKTGFFPSQVNFEDEARIKFLKLLGFSKDELERKVRL